MPEDRYKKIFSKNLRNLLEINNKTQTDLSKDLNLSSSTVSNWCTGLKLPRMNKIEMLANYFGVEKSDLIEDKSEDDYIESMKLPYKKVVPILGRIAAGRPICAIEEIEGYLPVTDPSIDFALRVQGDSMINARIFNGDIVQVQKDAYIKNGDIIVALIDGEDATIKRYYNYGDTIILKPENPTMHEWEFEPDEIQILGKVRRVTFNVY